MKFLVYGDENMEPVTYLRLVRGGMTSGVSLEVVDKHGCKVDRGTILTITCEGKLLLHSGLSNELGLEVGVAGRIVLDEPG